jgi:hypothetical protein
VGTIPSSTIPSDVPTVAEERRERTWRRASLGILTLFVALGLFGFLGVRSSTASATSGPLRVSLDHAVIARPALAVPYRLTITRDGGFDQQIRVTIDSDYLASFDANGSEPEPESSSTDGEHTIWEFEPPDGTVFTVWLDTRIEPAVQWRVDGSTTVTHGEETVTIHHPLWILP